VQIVPVKEVTQETATAGAFHHNIEVRVEALPTATEGNLTHSQIPRIVEVHDEGPEIEKEDFNMDLVDQLAREYLESSNL
jgi:hypothetical protein